MRQHNVELVTTLVRVFIDVICFSFPSQRSEKLKLRGWEPRRTCTNSTATLPSWASFSMHYPRYGCNIFCWHESCSLGDTLRCQISLCDYKFHVSWCVTLVLDRLRLKFLRHSPRPTKSFLSVAMTAQLQTWLDLSANFRQLWWLWPVSTCRKCFRRFLEQKQRSLRQPNRMEMSGSNDN